MKTLIVGCGGIGGTLAAYATGAGYPVTAVDANATHVAAIRAGGLLVVGAAEFTMPLDVRTPDEVDGRYDAVVLATRLADLDPVLGWLGPRLAPDGCVVPLQNGLPALRVAAALPPDRVLPGTVALTARYEAPGRVRLALTGPIHIGAYRGPATDTVRAVCAVLAPFAEAHDDVWAAVWTKLVIAAGFVALAVDGRPSVEVYRDPAQRDALGRVYGAVAAVAAATGVRPEPLLGIEVEPLTRWPRVAPAEVDRFVDGILALAEASGRHKPYSGVAEAVRAGVGSDADAILAPAVALGREHRVDVRPLEAVLAALRDVEAGRDVASPARLARSVTPEGAA